MTNAEARFNKSLRPRKPEGSLGRTAQDVHLDSHTAPELWMDLDPHIYLRQEGERHNRKPLLIVDYVASAVRDVEEIHPEAGQHDEAQAVIGRNPTVDSPIGAHMSTPCSLSFSV